MPQHDTIPSADLTVWEDFKRGDREAFAQLYQVHVHKLIAYGNRLSSEQSIVKDAIQDLFMELWRSREQLQPVRSIHFYLLGALRYKLMRNAKVRMRYHAEVPDQMDPFNIEVNILERETASQQQERLRHAIAQLPRRQQEVINLRFFQNCSTEDAAEIMGVNYQSVANLLHRAILQLREYLEIGIILLSFLFS